MLLSRLLAIVVGVALFDECLAKQTSCAYSTPLFNRTVAHIVAHKSVHTNHNNALETKSIDECEKDNFCYALWQFDPSDPSNASLYTVIAKGCWGATEQSECRASLCVSLKPVKALNNTKFCCCYGYLCNANISERTNITHMSNIEAIQGKSGDSEMRYKSNTFSDTLMIVSAAAVLCFVVVLCGFVFCLRAFIMSGMDRKAKNTDGTHLLESQSSTSQTSSAMCDLDNLKILEMIGSGRYGSVCKGTLNDDTVAVKIFASQHKHYYLNERDIYMLPFIEFNKSIPRFLGCQEKICNDGRLEYHLVLSYAPLGCLQDYLRSNTIDWSMLCKMNQTIAHGLSYLHSEIKKGDKLKHCVAHRDLSSRNIVINSDGSCMICDFQFAIRIFGSKYYSNGEVFDSQTASLNDVGTLRYMAPEILEGAVNLRDCESAMKQIDVYALGLVFWEIASRCTDLYQGIEVPPYKQPFEHEVGAHPSFEQMQVLVTRHKARPLFPDIWKDSNPAIRSLKETIEDCWDHDAEARLTALCVEERVCELPILWERYKSGTLNSCVASIYSINSQTQNFPNKNNHINALGFRKPSHSVHNIIGNMSSTSSQEGNDKLVNELQRNRFVNQLNNANDESLMMFSPSNDFEKNILSAANAFTNQPKLTLPLQPHQGRNPCLERNLMLESSDDDNTAGLLEHGLKFQNINSNNCNNGDNLSEVNASNESNAALVTNDVLSRGLNENSRNIVRRIGNHSNPIPFVQNAVGINTIPKQPNVPGNGHHGFPSSVNRVNKESDNKNSFLSKLLAKSALKGWQNLKSIRKRNTDLDIVVIEETQPFSPNNDNNDVIVLESQHSHHNVKVISPSPQPQLDNTEPKSTQVDMINGSAFTSIIDYNERSDDNNTNIWLNNQQNQNATSIDYLKPHSSIESPQ